jgi:OOP family OmpA-OmpF porin
MPQRRLVNTVRAMRLASLTVIVAAPLAHAQPLADEAYFVASVGKLNIRQTPMQADNNAIVINSVSDGRSTFITDMRSSQTTSNGGFKLQMGYDFSPNWSVEGGYVDLGKVNYAADYKTHSIIQGSNRFGSYVVTRNPQPFASSRTLKLSGWNVALLRHHPINDRLAIFGKLGLIHAQARASDEGWGFGPHANATESAVRPNLGIGLNYKLKNGLGVRAEYERFNKIGDPDVTGSADVSLMSMGLTGRF